MYESGRRKLIGKVLEERAACWIIHLVCAAVFGQIDLYAVVPQVLRVKTTVSDVGR